MKFRYPRQEAKLVPALLMKVKTIAAHVRSHVRLKDHCDLSLSIRSLWLRSAHYRPGS